MPDFLRQFAAGGQLSFKQTQNEMTGPAEQAGLHGGSAVTWEHSHGRDT